MSRSKNPRGKRSGHPGGACEVCEKIVDELFRHRCTRAGDTVSKMKCLDCFMDSGTDEEDRNLSIEQFGGFVASGAWGDLAAFEPKNDRVITNKFKEQLDSKMRKEGWIKDRDNRLYFVSHKRAKRTAAQGAQGE